MSDRLIFFPAVYGICRCEAITYACLQSKHEECFFLSFTYIWLIKIIRANSVSIQKLKARRTMNLWMLMKFVLISFDKPNVRKTLEINFYGYINDITIKV